MPADRFYFDGSLTQGAHICLEEAEHHHLRVVRIGVGETIELVNGRGSLAKGKLLELGKKSATVEVLDATTEPRPPLYFTLAIPLMRPSKLEFVVEKGTELGADAFHFYTADHSEKESLSKNQLERLHLLILSALKQSGRLYLPSIEILPNLNAVLRSEATLLYGDVRPDAKPLGPAESSTLFISGPERGFSAVENKLLASKASGVRLSPYILRAETAPLAAMAKLVM